MMSDDTQRVLTADLKLVLRNTEKSSRDAQAAPEATAAGGRLVSNRNGCWASCQGVDPKKSPKHSVLRDAKLGVEILAAEEIVNCPTESPPKAKPY
jgi:hypothetical protein